MATRKIGKREASLAERPSSKNEIPELGCPGNLIGVRRTMPKVLRRAKSCAN